MWEYKCSIRLVLRKADENPTNPSLDYILGVEGRIVAFLVLLRESSVDFGNTQTSEDSESSDLYLRIVLVPHLPRT